MTYPFRRLVFWTHLIVGCTVGLVILIMSVTGILLTYERQINAWVDRRQLSAFAPGSTRLPLAALLDKIVERERIKPATLHFHSAPGEPIEATLVSGPTVFVNPYTGDVAGEASKTSRSFFEVVERWHCYLGAQGEYRATGRSLTAVSNLAFLFLLLTGPFLWWPRKMFWIRVKRGAGLRNGMQGRVRDWNIHNVAGIWSVLPLFVIVFTGMTMSYPNFLYRVTGSEPTDPRVAPTRPQQAGSEPRNGGATWDGLDAVLTRAERQVPDWQTITMRIPGSSAVPVAFVIDRGDGGQPDKRSTLVLNRRTGEVVRWETFSNNNLGRRLRLWARYTHTGEQGGAIGQTFAGLTSVGGTASAFTGLALAVRRFLWWRTRRAKMNAAPVGRQAKIIS